MASLLFFNFPSLYLSLMNLHHLGWQFSLVSIFSLLLHPRQHQVNGIASPCIMDPTYANHTDRKLGRCRLVCGSVYSLYFEFPPSSSGVVSSLPPFPLPLMPSDLLLPAAPSSIYYILLERPVLVWSYHMHSSTTLQPCSTCSPLSPSPTPSATVQSTNISKRGLSQNSNYHHNADV